MKQGIQTSKQSEEEKVNGTKRAAVESLGAEEERLESESISAEEESSESESISAEEESSESESTPKVIADIAAELNAGDKPLTPNAEKQTEKVKANKVPAIEQAETTLAQRLSMILSGPTREVLGAAVFASASYWKDQSPTNALFWAAAGTGSARWMKGASYLGRNMAEGYKSCSDTLHSMFFTSKTTSEKDTPLADSDTLEPTTEKSSLKKR